MNDSDEVCTVCAQKLFDGAAVHTVRRAHWDCLPEDVKALRQ
jgi:hypothetical protein